MKGKLIVIEGIDGSGKTTQSDLLSQYLTEKNIPHEVLNFPRYEKNLYGKLIRRYLTGEFGSIKDVNPYLMALAYAGDRTLAKVLIESLLQNGKVVIANRFVSSSKAHLAANLPENKRGEFISWVDELEYKTNLLPKEDLTLFLDVEPKLGQENVRGEEGPLDLPSHKDIHENDLAHLQKAYEIYLEMSKADKNWRIVECMEEGKMKKKETIQKLIVEILNTFLVT